MSPVLLWKNRNICPHFEVIQETECFRIPGAVDKSKNDPLHILIFHYSTDFPHFLLWPLFSSSVTCFELELLSGREENTVTYISMSLSSASGPQEEMISADIIQHKDWSGTKISVSVSLQFCGYTQSEGHDSPGKVKRNNSIRFVGIRF